MEKSEKRIERQVFDLLKDKGMTFASAESCTGGNIAHFITLIPGSSEVFRGGAVTYATPTKTKVLGVPAKTIERYGVVSREVAEAMAKGTQKLMEADFGIATTGVAGPSGGTEQNPVGTVWIGILRGSVRNVSILAKAEERSFAKPQKQPMGCYVKQFSTCDYFLGL